MRGSHYGQGEQQHYMSNSAAAYVSNSSCLMFIRYVSCKPPVSSNCCSNSMVPSSPCSVWSAARAHKQRVNKQARP
jgi:hypothetical protein